MSWHHGEAMDGGLRLLATQTSRRPRDDSRDYYSEYESRSPEAPRRSGKSRGGAKGRSDDRGRGDDRFRADDRGGRADSRVDRDRDRDRDRKRRHADERTDHRADEREFAEAPPAAPARSNAPLAIADGHVDDPDVADREKADSRSPSSEYRPAPKKRFRRPFEDAPPGMDEEGNILEPASTVKNEPQTSEKLPVTDSMAPKLFTQNHSRLLLEATGATMEWDSEEKQCVIRGSVEQVRNGVRLLYRVTTHCQWGCNEEKIGRIMKPPRIESVVCRLSPMHLLPQGEKKLSSTSSMTLTVGKDKTSDLVVAEAVVSRVHCVLELDTDRGGVYIIDHSTNGTFLNGHRLPKATQGKVLISHGDEILLKDPALHGDEFGYIVNLQEVTLKPEPKIGEYRRLLSPSVGRHDLLFTAQQLKRVAPEKTGALEAPRSQSEASASAPAKQKEQVMTGARLAAKLGINNAPVLYGQEALAAAEFWRGGYHPTGMCGDFRRGHCVRGRACRYSHVAIEGSASHLAPGASPSINAVEMANVLAGDLAKMRAAAASNSKSGDDA